MENYFETVRLGYVGAFHKYESFIKSIIPLMDEFFNDLDFDENFLPITDYLKSEFGFEIARHTHNFRITKKINWISNCVKHYDSYPIKEPIPTMFSHYQSTKKIQIDSKEFKSDMKDLIKHNQLILTTLFHVGFHQFYRMDFKLLENQLKPESRDEKKVRVLRELLKIAILGILNTEKTVA